MTKESKAKEYAQSVASSIIENALEAAYLEGFNAGVESVEKPVTTIVENGVTYYDLGLPSGTMWSSHLWPDSNYVGKSYYEALKYNIPNKEQVNELIKNVKYISGEKHRDNTKIIGPNGKVLYWTMLGKHEIDKDNVSFWIHGEESSKDHTAEYLRVSNSGQIYISKEFAGYHMHLALVKTKE